MASIFYELRELYHDVYDTQILQLCYPYPPPLVQIELTITLHLSIVTHDCLGGRFINDNYTDYSSITSCFNLDVLENQDQAYPTIARLLARLWLIHRLPQFVDVVIDEIIRYGLAIANCESNKSRKILPLCAELWVSAVKHVDFERDMIRRALAESASEFERRYNYGMVPADKSMVKKMLKRVRVKDRGDQSEENSKKRSKVITGEDCVICLQEIKIESAALRMPCSHTFHGRCIETWLNQSHYCPICRFEMPT